MTSTLLIRVTCNGNLLDTKVLTNEHVLIGRSPECDVHIDDESVSRLHARILRDEDRFFLEDLRSKNGTSLGAEKVARRREILDGTVIKVGRMDLEVEIHAEPHKATQGWLYTDRDLARRLSQDTLPLDPSR
jgi:pSer/pThr/pTyr-binding forkhead associated (FHA) protein